MSEQPDQAAAGGKWHWHPKLPLEGAPVFVMPPRPLQALRWLFSIGFMGSIVLPYVATALISWTWLQRPLADCTTLEPGWILIIFARNLGVMVLVAGGLHLYLYRLKKQGDHHRFEARGFARNDPRFFARNQVLDNIFWSCASGVTLWSACEVLFMWGYANGALPFLAWRDNPVWFCALFVVIPFWQSLHFYTIHRLLHWKPLYRAVHALHHRNIVIGPWSGISMHPVEHVLYFSSAVLHLVFASHPVHVIFHMQYLVLSAAQSHSGYQDLVAGKRSVLALGDFFHQLHHRHFTCNYGTDYVPLDTWAGSFHDGTMAATRRLARQGRGKPG